MKPLVSVCIPTFNRVYLLEKAIKSVLCQTLSDIEILVIDDDSEEDVETAISSIGDERICYYRNSQNIGLVANFNKCVELAQGKFVSILHTDDYYEPEILERESRFLIENPKVGMVYTAYYLLHELSGRKKTILPYPQNKIFTGSEHFNTIVKNGNHIAFSGVMVPKSSYQNVGHFNVSLPYTSDLEMWLRLSLHYSIGYLATPMVTWRFHKEMKSFEFFKSAGGIEQEWKAIEMALAQKQSSSFERERCLAQARRQLAMRTMLNAIFHADKGMVTVRKHLTKAGQLSPPLRLHPIYWFIYSFSLLGDRCFSMVNRLRISLFRKPNSNY